jgi:2-keto-4-pentenoate hydratase/2-oxohepta-3-ene-1,7-dioic acid hydratase in catechol pathway
VSERRVFPARLLAPIEPTQIIGIGLNYRRHATEIGAAFPKFPVVFLKFGRAATPRRADFHSAKTGERAGGF